MSTIARLRILSATALGALGVGCVLFFLGIVTQVSASPTMTWYVAPDGDDKSGCGEAATPCRTIQYAIGEAVVGATVIITPGTFTESIQLNKALTLTGSGMGQTVIRTGSPGITVTASQVIISGTTIVGEGNEEGILVTGSITDVSILNSEIYSYSTGIQLDGGSGHVLRGNVIRDNSIGLVAAGNLSFVARNNAIRDNLTAGILFSGAGPIAATLSGVSSYANTFRNNGGANITVTLPSTNGNINAYWNDWGANTIAGVESTIYHKPDDPGLAKVDFYTLTIAAEPLSAAADGVTPVNITGTLSGFAAPGAGDVISFTKNLETLSAVTAATNPGGEASVVMTSTVAGTATITATSGIAINNIRTATMTVTLTAGALTTITVTPNPVTVTVGMTRTFSATGQDQYGNAVAITPTWTTNGGLIDSSGVFTAQITAANGRLVTATYGSISDTAVVTLTAGAPYTISALWAGSPLLVVGNSTFVNARVRDQFSNPVADGTLVTFTTDLGSMLPLTQTTMDEGFATSLISSQKNGIAHITTTSGLAQRMTTVLFEPDEPHTVTLQADSTCPVVGKDSLLMITVTDRYGNLVQDGALVTLSVSRGSVISPVTTTNGVATSLISDTLADTRLITAISGLAPAATTTLTLLADAPYTVTLVADPILQTAGSNSVLTATVTDQYNNPVDDGTPITFTVSRGNVLSPMTTTAGVATSLFSDTLVGTQVVTAASGSAPQVTTTVTFEPGEPFTITLVANPPSRTVGFASILNMTVTDQYANAVALGTEVTIDADRGNFDSPVTTDNKGNATSTIVAYQAGTDHITATSGTAYTTTIVTFTPGVPATVLLQADPISLTVGNNSVLTATVKDEHGNTVANGTPVTFTQDLGSLAPPVVTTTGGIATSLITSTLPGPAHITATSGITRGITTVTFIPGAPHTVTLVAAPTLLVVGNNSVLTATVTDQYNNRVEPGTPVTFTVSRGNVFSPVTTTNGVATSLFSDTLAGTRVVTAASGSAPQVTRMVTFTVDQPYTITVLVYPPNLVANSGATATITATIMDRYGNPLAGQILTGSFPTTTMGTIAGLGVTNAAGRAIGTWTAGATAGQAPLRVTNGSITGTQNVSLITELPTTITLQIRPLALIANSNMTSTITATVTDEHGNRLPNVSLTGNTVPSTLGSVNIPDLTNSNGQAFGTWLAGSNKGSGLLRVFWTSNNAISDTETITLTYGAPQTVTVQVKPAVLIAFSGATAPVTATVTDLYHNPLQGLTLNGGTSPATLGNVSWSSVTNASGQAFGAWTATKDSAAGSGLLQVSVGGAMGTVPITLTPGRIYLSVVMNNVRTELLQNGDFTQGLAGWTLDPNSKLSVSASSDPAVPGNPAALLGSPTYACAGGVPVGYGSLSQSIIMPQVPSGLRLVLKFNYHIYTDDQNNAMDLQYDRFDVLFNNSIVFTSMNRNEPFGCGNRHDLGRNEASVPVAGSPGDSVNITFRVQNGPDQLYDTYAYIDNVRLIFEPQP